MSRVWIWGFMQLFGARGIDLGARNRFGGGLAGGAAREGAGGAGEGGAAYGIGKRKKTPAYLLARAGSGRCFLGSGVEAGRDAERPLPSLSSVLSPPARIFLTCPCIQPAYVAL